jgi:hypothetical protein
MAQNVRKPIFKLSPADGTIGYHERMVREAENSLNKLTYHMIDRIQALKQSKV